MPHEGARLMWSTVLLLVVVCGGLIAAALIGLRHGLLPSVAVAVIALALIAGMAAVRELLAALVRRGDRHNPK